MALAESSWPSSAAAADAMMRAWPHFAEAHTLDLQQLDTALDELQRLVIRFLEGHARQGVALVKTSTTGDRPVSHEVSSWLLSFILELVNGCLGFQSVVLADGPAYAKSYQDECGRLGWDALAEKTGTVIADLNHDSIDEIEGWPVARTFLSADVVINLCKAKTHRRFGVSLGAKSLLGVLSGARLGYPKLKGKHRTAPWLIAALAENSPPALTIIDGYQGIEGEGPLHGVPTDSRFLSLGRGYYSPDLLAAVEMGFDPVLVPGFLRPAHLATEPRLGRWIDLRKTKTDFLPPLSCSWLYRSLSQPVKRDEKFQMLLRGAKECWATNK